MSAADNQCMVSKQQQAPPHIFANTYMTVLILYIFVLAGILYYVSLFTFNFKIDDGNFENYFKIM